MFGQIIDCQKVDLLNPNKELQSKIISIRKKLGMVFQSFNLMVSYEYFRKYYRGTYPMC
jgi:ABC-type polar amino acid transport system ATPase subunit